MFKSVVFCTLILSITAVSAHACNDIYFLRDGTKIYTQGYTKDDCNEHAYDTPFNRLKDGFYNLRDGKNAAVRNGCWSFIEKGGLLQDGRQLYQAFFTDGGATFYLNEKEQFMMLPDGKYYLKNDRAHFQNYFEIKNGEAEDYGSFIKGGIYSIEDRN